VKRTGGRLAALSALLFASNVRGAHAHVRYPCVRGPGSSLSGGAGVRRGLRWLTRWVGRLLGAESTSLLQADSPQAGGQMISATHEVFCVVTILELAWSDKLGGLLQARSHVPCRRLPLRFTLWQRTPAV